MNRHISLLNVVLMFVVSAATTAVLFATDSNTDDPPSKLERVQHVWEKVEITLRAHNKYDNPYTDVVVWVDLEGPGFKKRCYGFWDGENIHRIRVLATTPGMWTWKSGSKPSDPGL